jgi:uroporphyrinogen decarboxylase
MAMTGRERVLTVLNHEEPDRVPVIIGACNPTGMKARPYRALASRFGVTGPEQYLYGWPELGTVLPDEVVLRALHSDVRGVHDRFPAAVNTYNEDRLPRTPYRNDWGGESTEIEPGVWFQTTHPLAAMRTTEELDAYAGWPDMDDPSRVAHLSEQARQLRVENCYAVMGTPWLLSPFERAIDMVGMETLLTLMATEPDYVQALLAKIAGYCKALMVHFLEACGAAASGQDLDIVGISDDLGTERSLLISPRMYRRIVKPVHADYIAFIKAHTHAKVFLHSDGDIFDVLDDLVEIGVDILNPIQTTAGKMGDLGELKRRYGKNLVFCGGIDSQHILPHGTPAEVREEVRRVISLLGPGGGYMLAAVHTIMNETPAENVLAMTGAAIEFGAYPLR